MAIGNAITQPEANAGTSYLDVAGLEIAKAAADALAPLTGWIVVDSKRRRYPPTPVIDTQAAQDVKIAATESRLQKKVSSSLMFSITKAREDGSLTLAQLQTIEDNVDARITLNSDVVVDGNYDPTGDVLTVSDDKGGADLPVAVGAASSAASLWASDPLTVMPTVKPAFSYWYYEGDEGFDKGEYVWDETIGGFPRKLQKTGALSGSTTPTLNQVLAVGNQASQSIIYDDGLGPILYDTPGARNWLLDVSNGAVQTKDP